MARIRGTVLIICIAALVLAAGDLRASPRPGDGTVPAALEPFGPGETLEYRIQWGIIPAGRGEISVQETARGAGVYRIVTKARSNAFVDTFYRVRNRIETLLDLRRDCSLGYKKIQHEGHHNRNVDLLFDQDRGRATLVKNGEVKGTLRLPGPVHDPLSAIFYLRTVRDWSKEPELDVTDGKRIYHVRIRILGRETLRTPMGRVRTVKVEPVIQDMEIIFDKKKDGRLWIWLTDDERRLPVKMESELAFGSIQALLTAAALQPQP